MSRGWQRALAAASCALSALGCGTAPDPRSFEEQRKIRERVASFVEARARGDGAACAAYTLALRRSVERSGGGSGACERDTRSAAAALTAGVNPGELEQMVGELGEANRIVVELRGDRATAEYDPPPAALSPQPVALERVGGRWLISALRVPAARSDPL